VDNFHLFFEEKKVAEPTIFKRIIDGEIPAEIVHEDDLCLAFTDINPQAPVHLLVIPRKEIRSLDTLDDEDLALVGHLHMVIRDLARERGLDNGYRVVVNCGTDGGQTVDHLHFHLLAGRAMQWPPG
jgi:histidine triad (HIT) family protein